MSATTTESSPSIKISLSDRERNFCDDDSHRPSTNLKELIHNTRENELDDEKPLDEEKLTTFLSDTALVETVKVLELGGIKLTQPAVDKLANCGFKVIQCLRLYDCVDLNDEILKLFGQRFGRTIRDLELVGYSSSISDQGVKALIGSIGNLEALHLDQAIALLADYSGTITNMRHVWSKIGGDELEKLQQFTVKYAPYLRNLDITFSNAKEKTPEFVKVLGNLTGLTKLSITSTSNVSIETELAELLTKLAPNLTHLNLCVWCGGDLTLAAIGKLTKLQQLTVNGRSPMRHIDFRLETPLATSLASCTELRNLRLILKNHSKKLLDNFGSTFKGRLETLELEGLDLDDASLQSLSGLEKLGFLDIVSPAITDSGLEALIPKLGSISFLRVNDFGSEKIGIRTLDVMTGEARKRQPAPIEIVFTENAKIDIESRKSMLPPNLTVSQRNSTHLLSFPGSTPRGF